jgi:hypothetical protein
MDLLSDQYKLLRGGPKTNMELLKSINQDINDILSKYQFELNTMEIRDRIGDEINEMIDTKYRQQLYHEQYDRNFGLMFDEMIGRVNELIFEIR